MTDTGKLHSILSYFHCIRSFIWSELVAMKDVLQVEEENDGNDNDKYVVCGYILHTYV